MNHLALTRSAATSTALPAAFLSHGSPMFALQPGSTGPALTQWGVALRAGQSEDAPLRGVVLMSPHWVSRQPAVMTGSAPATWHDFGGFPPALYALQYPAPGEPGLAQEVLDLLQAAGIAAEPDAKRPFDHGAWVPLMHLFPQADLPVVQVALPADFGPVQVFAMGRALRGLRRRGVLLLGSGSMTHNLSEFFGRGGGGDTAYVRNFSRWVEAALLRGDTEALLDYRRQAPDAARAHPQEDHFLPIFFALGAADDGVVAEYLSREVTNGFLAMDSFVMPAAV